MAQSKVTVRRSSIDNVKAELGNAWDLAGDDVTAPYGSDAGGRARQDEVALLEREVVRHVADQVRDGEDLTMDNSSNLSYCRAMIRMVIKYGARLKCGIQVA